jgi:hypothetical protein
MSKKTSAVLGVFVTDTSVEAVLLRRSADNKTHVVGRYVKQRARRGERVGDLAAVIPGLRESTVSDYTMEVGDGSNGKAEHDIFLTAELDGLGVKRTEKGTLDKRPRRETTPFGSQLRDILADCRADGYESPQIAFCVGSSEVAYHEVGVPIPRDAGSKAGSLKDMLRGKNQRNVLLQKVVEAVPADIDKARVAFVPMTDDNNRWRFLAVAPFNPDPIAEAMDAVARKTRAAVPSAHLVDSEVTLLAALVRRQPDAEHGVVGVVRVSSNDTVVLFLKEGKLDRYEHIRSLTSYDPVDTVCSRVLLKQDELKIGKIDELYVSTEHHGEDAINTFRSFFPEGNVHALQDVLDKHGLADGEKLSQVRAQTLPALGVALRQLEQWTTRDREGILVNLLARKRRGVAARKKSPVRWHAYAAAAVLFAATLFYTVKFLTQQEDIDRREAEMALNPPDFPTESPALLKLRVDSLNAAYARYSRGLLVLDSLLIGSDQWSRVLDRMTESTRDIGRLWLKAWTPSGNTIRLEGNALERNRIARLAQLWNGSIDKLTFAEIQGIRIYTFSMTIPVVPELPEVARFLRENSLDNLAPGEVEALAGLRQAAEHARTN